MRLHGGVAFRPDERRELAVLRRDESEGVSLVVNKLGGGEVPGSSQL
jgi:hypothetical protein